MWKRLLTVLVAICAAQDASAVSIASASLEAHARWSVTPPDYPAWPRAGTVSHKGSGDSGSGMFVGVGPSWGADQSDDYQKGADRVAIFADSVAAADTGSAAGNYAYAMAQSQWSAPLSTEEMHLTIRYAFTADVQTSGRPTEFAEAMVDFSLKLVLETAELLSPVVLGDISFTRKIDQSDGPWWDPSRARGGFYHHFDYIIKLRGSDRVGQTPLLPDGTRRTFDILKLEMSAQVQTLAAVVAPVPVPPALPMAVCGLGLLAAVRRWGRSDRFHPA